MFVGLVSGVHMQISLNFFIVLGLTAFCFGAAGVAAGMLAQTHEDMANPQQFLYHPNVVSGGDLLFAGTAAQPFESLILVYPLTHASMLLRALAAGGAPPAVQCLYFPHIP